MTTRPAPLASRWIARVRRISGFQVVIVVVGLLVAGTLVTTIGRLAYRSWDTYGTGTFSFYKDEVFGKPAVRRALLNTAIIAPLASFLATMVAAVLAWLNERTDASIGPVGRILPLVPFLMPAISLPLGWIFLASPQAGVLNVGRLRSGFDKIGIHLNRGPLDIYTWPGLIFLYTVVLSGFAYLVLASPMRNLDRRLEDAAKMAGAGPLKILFRIVIPVLRPAMVSAFFLTTMIALVMTSVPLTVGTTADIPVVSVVMVNLITTESRPQYADAFLLGLLLLVPILILWFIQRRTAAGGPPAVIGAKAVSSARLRLGPKRKAIGRSIFIGYIFVAVVLPLGGLIYLSGLKFWSSEWPKSWSPVTNVHAALTNKRTQPAMFWSVRLGIITGVALIATAYLLSYGQRLFPKVGAVTDILAKSPAMVTQILTAVALLLTLGGAPFHLVASARPLFIGYFVVFLPFASVITTGALAEIGKDIVEVAKMSGASDFRTFRRIVTPLTWPSLVAGFLLMLVVVTGEVNVSLILASSRRPVVGFLMVDLFNFGSFPQVAAFALVVTTLNLTMVAVFMKVLSGRSARRRV